MKATPWTAPLVGDGEGVDPDPVAVFEAEFEPVVVLSALELASEVSEPVAEGKVPFEVAEEMLDVIDTASEADELPPSVELLTMMKPGLSQRVLTVSTPLLTSSRTSALFGMSRSHKHWKQA